MRPETFRSAQIAKKAETEMNPNRSIAAMTPDAANLNASGQDAGQMSGTTNTPSKRQTATLPRRDLAEYATAKQPSGVRAVYRTEPPVARR